MQADQPVSARRGRRLAVLIACRAPDTRFAVAQDARRDNSRPTTIRNPGNIGGKLPAEASRSLLIYSSSVSAIGWQTS